MINSCEFYYEDDCLSEFYIGNLTSKGFDFLEKIRDEKTWEKIKLKANEEKLPKTVETITRIAGVFLGNMLKELS
jgi:hypothetical protein